MSNKDNEKMRTAKDRKNLYKYTDLDFACASRMYERIKAVIPYTPTPNLESWADTLRKMRTLDNIDIAEIGSVFRWANQDDFWQTNILSPAKLRKHFARLHKLMLQDITKQHQPRNTKDIPFTERLTDRSWANTTKEWP